MGFAEIANNYGDIIYDETYNEIFHQKLETFHQKLEYIQCNACPILSY